MVTRPVDANESATAAWEHLCALAGPRRAGTEGEMRARRYLVDRLRRSGYKVEEEEFSAVPHALDLWRVYGVAVALLLLLAAAAPAGLSPLREASAAAILGMFLLLPYFFRWACSSSLCPGEETPALTARQGRRGVLRSANVVARLPGGAADERGGVILVAHYDSKSQNVPLLWRMGLSAVVLLAGGCLALLVLARGAVPLAAVVPSALLVSALAALGVLLGIRTGSVSPGAIDNAAGVAVLLHIAERMVGCGRRPQASPVTFRFTGAEEEGLLGAWAYLARHNEELRALRGRAAVLNLDGIGVGRRVVLIGGGLPAPWRPRGISARAAEAARRVGVPLWRIGPLCGIAEDHVPFAAAGLDAISLCGPSWKLSRVHSARDCLDAVDPAALGRVAELTWQVVVMCGSADAAGPASDSAEREWAAIAPGAGGER